MPQDQVIEIDKPDGWVEVTTAAVSALQIFNVTGSTPVVVQFRDTQPTTDDARIGIEWRPDDGPVVDFALPGGPTRVWVRAFWGPSGVYIKHA